VIQFQAMAAPKSIDIPIHTVRSQRVVLDSDLAALYGVSTGRFNEAIKRNLKRFPEDFAFQLSAEESLILISQIAISSFRLSYSRSQFATLETDLILSYLT